MEKTASSKGWLAALGCGSASWRQVLWACVFMISASLTYRLFPAGASIWLKLGIVICPVIPGVLYITALVRDVRRMDEMQQKIFIEAIAGAFAGMFLLAVLYPTIRKAGFVSEPNTLDFAVVMLVLTAISYAIAKVRYR